MTWADEQWAIQSARYPQQTSDLFEESYDETYVLRERVGTPRFLRFKLDDDSEMFRPVAIVDGEE